ncbi:hypothetical protein [Reyranella sp.]|uniref:hypothetical protein n=1 Tax=Reyranella sp. TaxID=1929291 RepID=UPI003D0D2C25
MGRAILSLAGFEIGGSWLLVSTLELMPIAAYALSVGAASIVVTLFILRASWSLSRRSHHRGGFGSSNVRR